MLHKYDTLGVRFRAGQPCFLFATAHRSALGLTPPPIQRVTGALSLGITRPGREADRSLLSSTEVKNAWSYTSIVPYVFMARCLVKHSDNFSLYLYINIIWWEYLCVLCYVKPSVALRMFQLKNSFRWYVAFGVHSKTRGCRAKFILVRNALLYNLKTGGHHTHTVQLLNNQTLSAKICQ